MSKGPQDRPRSGGPSFVAAWLAAAALALAPDAGAQGLDCNTPSPGPDVVVAGVFGVTSLGSIGTRSAYAVGVEACNFGDAPLSWAANTASHPVVTQNLYRIANGRIDQIGLGWVTHGHSALASSTCCVCQPPGTSQLLGVGCSTASSANLHGLQSALGPRSDVDPATGVFPFPYTGQGQGGDFLHKRLQVEQADLDPALNPGARYFVEVQVVAADDAQAGHGRNNVSVREVAVGPFGASGWTLSLVGSTHRAEAAVETWSRLHPSSSLAVVDVPGDGRLMLASLATDLGGGTWRYDFALYNLNSHRAAAALSVPLPLGSAPSDIGFRDVDYHSGEVYDGTDWPAAVLDRELVWSTVPHALDPHANAVRWGTTYRFSFEVDAPPVEGPVRIDLFEPPTGGAPRFVAALARVPARTELGFHFCSPGEPNSTGSAGTISATGSPTAAANQLELTMASLPAHAFGYFLTSRDAGLFAPPGAGPQPLCLGGSIGRFSNQVTGAGALGEIRVSIDLSAMPVTPNVGVQAGETWHFQGWHRDAGTSQFTEAVGVPFQ